jgi:hypothetical protein
MDGCVPRHDLRYHIFSAKDVPREWHFPFRGISEIRTGFSGGKVAGYGIHFLWDSRLCTRKNTHLSIFFLLVKCDVAGYLESPQKNPLFSGLTDRTGNRGKSTFDWWNPVVQKMLVPDLY